MLQNSAETIGNTPLVLLQNITKGLDARIAVKLEYLNPSISVKDRAAKSMVDDAEKRGLITPGKSVLVEATSGNLGIALAHIGKIRGYKVILIMPSVMSIERRAMIKAYGAEVILSDPAKGFEEMISIIDHILENIPNSHCLDQLTNPANPMAHYQSTGPEIWKQTEGKVDIVVFGVGSSGTITGTGRYLKEQNKDIKVVAVEPFESSVLSGLPAGPHGIHGIGAGMIPPNMDLSLLDDIVRVKTEEALDMARRLGDEEGILGGISSGANVVAAVKLAKRPENKGKLIVTSVNSYAERYCSTELYSSVLTEVSNMETSNAEQAVEISRRYMTL